MNIIYFVLKLREKKRSGIKNEHLEHKDKISLNDLLDRQKDRQIDRLMLEMHSNLYNNDTIHHF